jgi:hypothetical protein
VSRLAEMQSTDFLGCSTARSTPGSHESPLFLSPPAAAACPLARAEQASVERDASSRNAGREARFAAEQRACYGGSR